MFYINKKNLKGYSAVNYLKTEKFKENIQPQLFKLIKKKWSSKNSLAPLFEISESITDPLASKLNSDSLTKINQHCSYLGKWSEFFLENLVELCRQKKCKNWSEIDLKRNWKIIKQATEESKKYFSSKTVKHPYLEYFFLENFNSFRGSKYSFFLEQENFKNHKNTAIFMSIMNHFKSFLPLFTNFISWNQFTKLHAVKTKTDFKNECEISGWEFDFFDSKELYIIDLKFQKKGWDINWVWQLLLYVYLLDFYYGIRSKGIALINTYSGEKWKITLEELFVKNGEPKFFELLKLEISDYEKIRFMNRILSCFKDWTTESNLEEIISNNFFISLKDKKIKKYKDFIEQLNRNRSNPNFLSNIHSPKWVWQKWTKFTS